MSKEVGLLVIFINKYINNKIISLYGLRVSPTKSTWKGILIDFDSHLDVNLQTRSSPIYQDSTQRTCQKASHQVYTSQVVTIH